MALSKIELKLSIHESEESKAIPDVENEDGWYEKDRFLLTVLYIDGERITDDFSNPNLFMGDVADFGAFVVKSHNPKPNWLNEKEKMRYSGFYPITCSCGEAGCAGIWDGVHSFHKKNIVKWKITDGKTRRMLGAKYLSFDRKQYEAEIDKIWKFLHENKDEVLYEYGSKSTVQSYLDFWKEKFPELYKEYEDVK